MSAKDGERSRAGSSRSVRVAAVSSSKQHIKEHRAYKLIVIGSSGVGKTCLSCMFADGACPSAPEATIGVDFREKKVVVEREIIKLQLWDTAGQERFRQSMTTRYYRDAHAMIVMYDITSMASFRHCQSWLDEARRHTDAGVRICALVGNKCDEVDRREVTTRLGQQFAEANDMLFFETTTQGPAAKEMVRQVFFTIAVRLTERRAAFEESIRVRPEDMAFSLLPSRSTTKADIARSHSFGNTSVMSAASTTSSPTRVTSSLDVVHNGPDVVPPLDSGRCCKTS
ncbi:putative Ras-related protein Rab-33 [Sycon ciliatum]|uniref:putative Ras-related protein Rab-33 n=1 Tax=Sycon ciliatum TaxID=27933 RepID=UPI0020AD383D|eukprot:scpid89433/ scgid0950/ Ras-related protein Rab-33A; Small GTP-binding protein S10